MLSLDIMGLLNNIYGKGAKATDRAPTRLAKPKMRGLLHAQIKRNIFFAFTGAIASGMSYKIFVADVRKRKYAEYYRTLDVDKQFEEMRRKGLFQSC